MLLLVRLSGCSRFVILQSKCIESVITGCKYANSSNFRKPLPQSFCIPASYFSFNISNEDMWLDIQF